jgi:hypothetical protein
MMKELLDNERIRIAILAFFVGVIVTFILYPKPEIEEVYKFSTKTETDTVYKEIKDTVYIPKTMIKTEVLRDTILVDYKPTIKSFSATTPFEYGNTYVNGEVLGEVLKMNVTNDFKIPVVTNTITNTETKTIIKKSKGLYLGATINSMVQPGASASYVDDKYIFQYQYQPMTKIHSLGISKKLF